MTTSHRPSRRFGDGGITLAELGESELLQRLAEIAAAGSSALAAVADDDAAIWTAPPGDDLAVSIDAVVEGVDFRRSWLSPWQLGRRAFHVAASDMAAMGALPLQCLVTLCAGAGESAEDLFDIQRGICTTAASLRCAVVGGDLSSTGGPLMIDICITGTLPRGRALRRRAGRPNDILLVTGSLGRAAAGLHVLLEDSAPVSSDERSWCDAQVEALARVAEGRHLLDAGVRCAGDLSDGLLVDADRTARCSGCAAELWVTHLPVEGGLRARFRQEWLELAIAGGEDFELLASVPETSVDGLLAAWPGGLAPLTIVGRLTEGSGVRLLDARDGQQVPLPRVASRHFS